MERPQRSASLALEREAGDHCRIDAAGSRAVGGRKSEIESSRSGRTGDHTIKRVRSWQEALPALIRNREIVYSTGGRASGALACHLTSRRRLLTGAHKECVLSGLQIGVEGYLVDSDAHVLGTER